MIEHLEDLQSVRCLSKTATEGGGASAKGGPHLHYPKPEPWIT